MTSASALNSEISAETYIVPVIEELSAAEYRKLKALVQDLVIRNISMRYKYIARLFCSGMLAKMVNLFKGSDTIRKRKRSDNEGLSNLKRKPTDHLHQITSNTIAIQSEAHRSRSNLGGAEVAHQDLGDEGQSKTKQYKDRDDGNEVFTQEPYAPSNQSRSNYELAKYIRRQTAAQTNTFNDVSE